MWGSTTTGRNVVTTAATVPGENTQRTVVIHCLSSVPSAGLTYHDEDGSPIINTDRFPNMSAMTEHAHNIGLTSGWYGNNW